MRGQRFSKRLCWQGSCNSNRRRLSTNLRHLLEIISAYEHRWDSLTEVDSKNSQERSRIPQSRVEARCIRIDIRRRLSNQDTEKDKGPNPRVLFEGVNQGESEYGDYVGDDGDDDDSHSYAESIVRYCAEDLTDDDIVHDCETAPDYHVEDGAKLCTPPAEGVTRGCDGAKTKLGQVSERCSLIR